MSQSEKVGEFVGQSHTPFLDEEGKRVSDGCCLHTRWNRSMMIDFDGDVLCGDMFCCDVKLIGIVQWQQFNPVLIIALITLHHLWKFDGKVGEGDLGDSTCHSSLTGSSVLSLGWTPPLNSHLTVESWVMWMKDVVFDVFVEETYSIAFGDDWIDAWFSQIQECHLIVFGDLHGQMSIDRGGSLIEQWFLQDSFVRLGLIDLSMKERERVKERWIVLREECAFDRWGDPEWSQRCMWCIDRALSRSMLRHIGTRCKQFWYSMERERESRSDWRCP